MSMSKRPIPHLDAEALARLANQYPGSDRLQSSESSEARRGSFNEASEKRSEPTSGEGGRRRGFGVWSFLFALIALVAAVVSVSGPSLRGELRQLLTKEFPQLSPKTIDLISGYDTNRLEITYDGLDERISQLSGKLTEIANIENVSSTQLREILLKTESTAAVDRLSIGQDDIRGRMSQFNAEMSDRIGVLSDTTEANAKRLNGIDAELRTRRAAANEFEAAVEASNQQFLKNLTETDQAIRSALAEAAGDMSQKLDASSAAVVELQEKLAALEQSFVAMEQRADTSDSQITTFGARLDDFSKMVERSTLTSNAVAKSLDEVASVIKKAEAWRETIELPILALSMLRHKLNTGGPYSSELALLNNHTRFVDPAQGEAYEVLESYSVNGTQSFQQLRRNFRFIAAQGGKQISRIEDWSQRVTYWLDYVFGVNQAPETMPAGQPAATMASIDAALEAEEINLAIDEAVLLSTRFENGLMTKWIAEARRRQAVERAYETIAAAVFKKIENS
jgi:hypothetical protein